MRKEELADAFVNAVWHADKKAIESENGCDLSSEFSDFDGLVVVLHDSFLTVGFEGDSEMFDTADLATASKEAADAVFAMFDE